jgi:hypothetical protein
MMEQREIQRQDRPATTAVGVEVSDREHQDEVLRALGTLLETARNAVSDRLSADSRRYLRAATQHGGE